MSYKKTKKFYDWNCPNCKKDCWASEIYCPKCPHIRNPFLPIDLGNKNGDWLCIQCNFTVFGRKTECGKCERKKGNNSSKIINKKKDWLCKNCNFMIFGRKKKCTKCGEMRDKC